MTGYCFCCGDEWGGDHTWICPNCGGNAIFVEGQSEQWGDPFPRLTSQEDIESGRNGEASLFNEKERTHWQDIMI